MPNIQVLQSDAESEMQVMETKVDAQSSKHSYTYDVSDLNQANDSMI